MNSIARNWRVVVGGVAAGSAALLGFAGVHASAEPVLPLPPAPAPATVTQTVTVTPQAAAAAVPAAAAAAPAAVPAAPLAAAPAVAPAAAAPAAAVPAAAAPAAAVPAVAPAVAPAVVPAPQLPPATSGTLAEFFGDKGVVMEPQKAEGFIALSVVLPMPTGWSVVPDPNVPDAFTVLADRQGGDALYTPNAQLKIYKLVGEFDPREAISHGYIDSQKLFAWQSTAASMADFGGFPSSVIGGTYRENDVTLNTSRRHLIAQSGADRYLVSLFVTTSANQVVATAAATDAIVNGFKVIDPATIPQVPAAAAAAAAPAAGSPAEVPAVASAPVTAAAAPAAAATAPEATAPALEVPTLVAPAPAPAVTAAPTAATPAS
jgi:hypothetical protein